MTPKKKAENPKKSELRQAYSDGYRAFRTHVPRDRCPGPQWLEAEWYRGWDQAKEDWEQMGGCI